MEIHYQQQAISLREGETVLNALLRRGLPVRHSCRAGSCQTCMMRATSGRPPSESQRGLTDERVADGYFLPCKCRPFEPLHIESPETRVSARSCCVIEAFMLCPGTRCIRLAADSDIDPVPGQHIGIVHPLGEARRYSVASLPRRDGYIELHVERIPRGRVSSWLVDEVRVGDRLEVQPPSGNLACPSEGLPGGLLLVSTGTGLAPMMPLVRDALDRDDRAPIWLIHGARTREGLYADSWLRVLDSSHPRFRYRPCCTRQPDRGQHFHGRVTDWLTWHGSTLNIDAIRVAGRRAMVDDVVAMSRRQSGESALDIRTDPFDATGAPGGRNGVPGAHVRRAPPPDHELWSRLGNGRILREVLRDFYDLAFEDERLGPYFTGVTRQRLREKQYSFLRSLILGRRDYMGQRPRNAHHWMVISHDLFDYRLALMAQCMRDHGLSEPWIERWHVFEDFFRSDIVKDEPLLRSIGGQELVSGGVEASRLDDGGICDGCQRVIECGENVRFHLEIGAVYCAACCDEQPTAGPAGKKACRTE